MQPLIQSPKRRRIGRLVAGADSALVTMCHLLVYGWLVQGGSGNAQAVQWALRSRSRASSGLDHADAKLEVSGPDGGAVQLQTEVTVIDARLLTPEQRNAFKQVLLAARAQGELSP